ncbi:uncharacterized protein Z519_03326 [Cladophialophora bantiana CBS 173.52]|uniref:F-box domain-containing protein n=1 Tax=Cladophialophora bantiana (strain ATCC 10958 / CBS 173.52 / CDC B-1940 / NIH 8579) TaxID=1442370 RepID=A0A0D2HS00_CLAB1|nr:uncharacterized protein Z519_03326 [Cladophialophora bantiana CBS 173.52]KIW96258.1 hypothetical protein Z519_03326 [Cladophialophora bantiana CBS 173.52]
MFQDLPVEVIQQIVGFLPTVSAIVNLSLTNRKIHSVVSADDYGVFRKFVQRCFPTIKSPPYWKDVARTLTSRSRAWDRRAFIAEECCPPPDDGGYPPQTTTGFSIGYRPVIDSYEAWLAGSWADRKEVLAWGAAGRLRLRTIENGVTTWSSFRVPDDHRQELDILDVRILRPHQHENSGGEMIVLQRANQEVISIESSSQPDAFTQKSRYTDLPDEFTCMDISQSTEPILAACGDHRINLYPVNSPDKAVRPASSTQMEERQNIRSRMRCVKFLSKSIVAIANQFLEGRGCAPIRIYNIHPAGVSPTPIAESMPFTESSQLWMGRHSSSVIVGLDDVGTSGGRPQQLFLSGWTDGTARLYDIRTPQRSVSEYVDPVDIGQIISLLPIGHERFLAGSSHNGCLKTFDFRMPGARAYSYLDARPDHSADRLKSPTPQRDINIFLTPTVNISERLWEPLSRHPRRRSQRYRSCVYSLSSPSPSSPTVYAGIGNHVLQLDFISTDDFRNGYRVSGLDHPRHHIPPSAWDKITRTQVLNFSCYERPREGRESTDPLLLRKQTDLIDELANHNIVSDGEREDGWDERWRLNTKDNGYRDPDWRRAR